MADEAETENQKKRSKERNSSSPAPLLFFVLGFFTPYNIPMDDFSAFKEAQGLGHLHKQPFQLRSVKSLRGMGLARTAFLDVVLQVSIGHVVRDQHQRKFGEAHSQDACQIRMLQT